MTDWTPSDVQRKQIDAANDLIEEWVEAFSKPCGGDELAMMIVEATSNAARAVDPPATMDAFEQELRDLCGLAAQEECDWQFRDWDTWLINNAEFADKLQTVLDLYAKAAGYGEVTE